MRTADIFKKTFEAKAKTNTNNMMNLAIPGKRSGSNTSKTSNKSRGSSRGKSRVKSASGASKNKNSNSAASGSKNGSARSGRPPLTAKKPSTMVDNFQK